MAKEQVKKPGRPPKFRAPDVLPDDPVEYAFIRVLTLLQVTFGIPDLPEDGEVVGTLDEIRTAEAEDAIDAIVAAVRKDMTQRAAWDAKFPMLVEHGGDKVIIWMAVGDSGLYDDDCELHWMTVEGDIIRL